MDDSGFPAGCPSPLDRTPGGGRGRRERKHRGLGLIRNHADREPVGLTRGDVGADTQPFDQRDALSIPDRVDDHFAVAHGFRFPDAESVTNGVPDGEPHAVSITVALIPSRFPDHGAAAWAKYQRSKNLRYGVVDGVVVSEGDGVGDAVSDGDGEITLGQGDGEDVGDGVGVGSGDGVGHGDVEAPTESVGAGLRVSVKQKTPF